MRSGELSLELLASVFPAEEQVAFDALELAVDVFHRCDALDAMNRRHMALSGETRAFLSVELFDVVIAVVESGGEMGSSSAGFAATDRAVIDDDDRATCAREQVGRRHAGDARSDYADIRTEVLREGLELGHFSCAHPDGGRVT